jgi:hypothetical protein
MSLETIRQDMLGIPGTNFGLVTTRINEAFTAVQNENVWSFQLKEGGWLTPGLLGSAPGTSGFGYGQGPYGGGPYGGTVGTVGAPATTAFLSPGNISITPFTDTVTGDAVASAAWRASVTFPPLITQQQFRVPYYSLYNIIAMGQNGSIAYVDVPSAGSGQTPGTYSALVTDLSGPGSGAIVWITVDANGAVSTPPIVASPGANYQTPVINFAHGGTPPLLQPMQFATLQLDRVWMEPNQLNASYMIYQAYFAAPPGFKRWYTIRDTTNNNWINWWSFTQVNLSEEDPERINFLQPTNLVPYQMDTRPGSATYGQMLYELWPHPIMQLPYSFSCQANWPPLQNPNDTLPYPLTDELIRIRAYEMTYLWKESQKGDEMERGSGANWQFLSQAMRNQYQDRLKTIRNMDRNLVDLYFTKMRRMPQSQQVWGTVTGQAAVGGWDS